MKKIISIIFVLTLLSFKTDSDKKYLVTLSLNEWQSNINYIEAAKNAIRQSNLPVNAALPLIDSLSKMENEFISQLQPQLNTKPIIDSGKVKK